MASALTRCSLFALLLAGCSAQAADPALYEAAVAQAKGRWEKSPHGPLLERILPPTFEPRRLPEPRSRGAELTVRYCVQCHNLPNPAMHDAAKWPAIVSRMVPRMEGRGNLGKLMADMMDGVQAPSEEEERIIVRYLRKHAQRPLDPKRYPEVWQASGEPFRVACNQCHVLPDPKRYTARQWPAVVSRMQENMEWMNRVVASKPIPGGPQLTLDAINAFLARHARRP